ncbi:MAG: hypothetical protein EPN14_03185 [Gallionella sp.]|nr:MAG: hypothetical protein EPN14_03185 [Gallionella sp.]
MNKRVWIAMAIALPCVAVAAEPPGKKPRVNPEFERQFNNVDTDKDGKISKEEAAQKAPTLAASFEGIDTGQDGYLSKNEIIAAQQKVREGFSRRLQDADRNKDGKLSREEAQAIPNVSARFDDIDANRDGQLVLQEINGFLRNQGKTSGTQ